MGRVVGLRVVRYASVEAEGDMSRLGIGVDLHQSERLVARQRLFATSSSLMLADEV